MRKFPVFALFILVPIISLAQYGQRGGGNPYGRYRYEDMQYETSVLSVFSEDGAPFFLVLNGVRQNPVPQSKIRVESLPKYVTDVQVEFPNSRMRPLRKTVSISDPVDGRAVNLVLRISKGRDGLPRLKFHRMTECDRNYHGPRDEYVMYYGKPQQVNTVTETSYLDPITGQWVTETTTTTTTDDRGYNNNYNDNRNNRNDYNNNNYTPPPAPSPMDPVSFDEAKRSIAGSTFEETKLSTAKTIIGMNHVSTNQVMEICRMFSFENTKITFAKFAYDRTVDPQNYFKVAGVLDFDSNKKALNDYIMQRAH